MELLVTLSRCQSLLHLADGSLRYRFSLLRCVSGDLYLDRTLLEDAAATAPPRVRINVPVHVRRHEHLARPYRVDVARGDGAARVSGRSDPVLAPAEDARGVLAPEDGVE